MARTAEEVAAECDREARWLSLRGNEFNTHNASLWTEAAALLRQRAEDSRQKDARIAELEAGHKLFWDDSGEGSCLDPADALKDAGMHKPIYLGHGRAYERGAWYVRCWLPDSSDTEDREFATEAEAKVWIEQRDAEIKAHVETAPALPPALPRALDGEMEGG